MTFGFWGTVWLGETSLLRCAALHLADPLLHLFSGFERDHKLFGDKDFVSRAGIAGLTSRPSLDLKHAKIPQLNAMVLDQGLDDGIEGLLDDFLGLKLCQPNLFGDGFDNLFLGHVKVPYATGQMNEATLFRRRESCPKCNCAKH
jgi:hypothetical protein